MPPHFRTSRLGESEPSSQCQITAVFLENDGYGRFVRFSVNTLRIYLHEEAYTKSPKSVISVTFQTKRVFRTYNQEDGYVIEGGIGCFKHPVLPLTDVHARQISEHCCLRQ